MASSILIVEDDLVFSTMMKTWLTKKGFEVDTASTNARARKLLAEHRYDLILSDLRLPDQDGIHLLAWLRNRSCHTPLIIMTSYAEIQSAVEAMKQGASDYIAKPVQPDELLKKIKEAVENAEAPAAPGSEKTAPPVTQNFLEGESEAAHQLFNYVRLVAPTQMSVLINGASGTGKEYVAHRIHELSKRNGKPFIAIDCGSIPKDLAASEFFGHVKGSFTGALTDKAGAFEEANGGTLFLDEIGNLSYEVQIQVAACLARTAHPPHRFDQRNRSGRTPYLCHQRKPERGHCQRDFPRRPVPPHQRVYPTHARPERTPGRHPALCQFLPRPGKPRTGTQPDRI